MFKKYFSLFYIQILKDEFLLFDANTEVSLNITGNFSGQRTAVANFTIAEKLLSQALKELISKKSSRFLAPSPIIIMHPKYLCEGGLSQVEERVLKELAFSSGAMKVYIWEGADLTAKQLLNGIYK